MRATQYRPASSSKDGRSAERLVRWLTIAAWVALTAGLLLSVTSITPFNDQNLQLMVGIGCMVGSVHVYAIRTFIHLVHARDRAFSNS